MICNWEISGENRENWGDALNPYLVRLLSGKQVVNAQSIFNVRQKPVYAVVGSTLQSRMQRFAGRNLEIWGAGLIGDERTMRTKPRAIHAVRGPLTRAKLENDGIPCPAVYGDPSLLFPLFYTPVVEKRYEIGIVPHYLDQNAPDVRRLVNGDGVAVINIKAGINRVVDQIAQCRLIVSSSLHGLIAAESYGIPAIWVGISDQLIGGDFKFLDYYASTGRPDVRRLKLSEVSSPEQLTSAALPPRPTIDLEALLRSCPFLDPGLNLSERLASHPMVRSTALG